MAYPKFKPEAWVIFMFNQKEPEVFGKVVGGRIIDEEWNYYIQSNVPSPTRTNTTDTVPEKDIIAVWQGDKWRDPNAEPNIGMV